MGFSVQGKVALVTGANRGIGKAIVASLVEHGAAKIYAAVRNLDSAHPLLQAHGDRIVPVKIDLCDPQTILDAASACPDVQLVVCNAGVLNVAQATDNDAIDKLQDELTVNVFGLMRMAQAFGPVLKANGGGALVQLNSVASLLAFSDFATYCASKAAAYSLTQSLRVTLGQQGTQVLSVHPGPIETDMAAKAGLAETDPPEVVSEGIVQSLANGDFHLFPDSFAQQLESVYRDFATNIVEAAGNAD